LRNNHWVKVLDRRFPWIIAMEIAFLLFQGSQNRHQAILELPANITQLNLMFSKRWVVVGLLFPILEKGTTIKNLGKPLFLPVLNARSTINPDL
jgi:hypothetical protein